MKLCHMQSRELLWRLLLISLLSYNHVVAYTPEARWGQASTIINDVLFVQGGKEDRFNSYSYTSAPNTNDLFYLSLSQPFDAANPPWELISSSTNSSTSQGPAVSWHTLSAYNTSQILLFGGQPGQESPSVERADSAYVLDVFNRLQPVWQPQLLASADQPVRRIHHSVATSASGTVYIIGGEKADGSGNTRLGHYMYDPMTSAFSQLPSDNGPSDIYGHVSIMFPDGRLFVFGGVSQNSLNPLSTIWVLDTSRDPPVWSTLQVDANSLPSPRRSFAAVRIGDTSILIHGGSDISTQVDLDDGWILDISRVPAVWTRVDLLTQLGPRRDHLAISWNGQVIVGFGYSNSGPASAAIQIFDPSSNTFLSSFTPQSPSATVTQTIPGQSTSTRTSGSATGTQTTGGSHPTATAGPGGADKRTPVAAIAIGTTLGILGAIAVGVGVFIYTRRQRQRRAGQRSFLLVGDDEDGGNSSLHAASTIPVVTMHNEKDPPSGNKWGGGLIGAAFGIAGSIGAAAKLRSARNTYERRDMLADEDTHDFGEWYNSRRRDGTGGSSWSLMSIVGGRFKSREPSTHSHRTGASHRHERTDPFSDGTSLMLDDGLASPGLEGSSRPQYRRETSHISFRSVSYVDPFADPIREEKQDEMERDVGRYHDEAAHEYEPTSAAAATSRLPQSLPTIRTVLPTLIGGHALSPLSEHTSKASLALNDQSTSASSHTHSSENPFDTSASRVTSYTSVEPSTSRLASNPTLERSQSPKLLLSSMITANSPPSNIRRSDSWWSRFYHTSFLDRRSGSTSRRDVFDIRDPKPPPALGPIQEGSQSASPEESPSKPADYGSTPGQLVREGSRVYRTDHGESRTSLRTVDTELIERMAGTMDVVQRVRTRSHRTSGSISSGLSIDTRQSGYNDKSLEPSELAEPTLSAEVMSGETSASASVPPLPSSTPPLALPSNSSNQQAQAAPTSPAIRSQTSSPPINLHSRSSAPGTPTNSTALHGPSVIPTPESPVAARIQMYERRMSQDQEKPSLTNTRQREERSAKKERVAVNYGFVPRPSLFVANPDHRPSYSNDS